MTKELDWGNMSTGGGGEQTQFLKLENGDNRIRVVGKPVTVDLHWEETLDGGKKKVICPGAGCPICKAGHVPQSRYQVLVIDRKDSKVKILEGGPRIFGSFREYAMDPEYGDPTKYDMKIKKEGAGRETKYTVVAAPTKKDLTAEETELVLSSKTLLEINKAKSIDEIYQLGLSVLAGSVGDLATGGDDDFGATPKTGGATAVGDDDWESL